MEKKDIKKLVLYQFRDYDNLEHISSLFDDYIDEVIDSYDLSSNISEDIYCSFIICNKINYALLTSTNDDDILYMIDKSERIYKTICDVKKNNNIPYDEDFDQTFDYVQTHYNGNESYALYFNKVIQNKLYNEPDVEEDNNIYKILKNMWECEMKLRNMS